MIEAWTLTPEACLPFNQAFNPHYHLDWRLLRQVTVDRPGFDPAWCLAWTEPEVIGFLLAKASPNQIWIDAIGVRPDRRRRGIGRALLARVLERAEGRKVSLGGGPAHLFPGLPSEFDESLGFFEGHRFTQGAAPQMDLILRPEQPLAQPEPGRLQFLPCPAGRAHELEKFVETEFPGRWASDTRLRLSLEPPTDVVVGLAGEKIAAFCHTWREANAILGPSLNWRQGLRQPGGIGPVGVAQQHRGGGAGLALTLASLHHLRSRGAQDIVVDWTTLESFYRRAGFLPWRRYRPLSYQTGGSASN